MTTTSLIRGLRPLIAALAAIPLVVSPAGAALLVDQLQESGSSVFCVVRSADAACYQGAAQTVTAGESGGLLAVDLLMSRGAQTTSDLTVELRGGGPDGPLLATSDPVPPSEIPVGSYDGDITEVDWVTATFPVPPQIESGDVIAIVIPPLPLDGAAWGWVGSGDVYEEGTQWGGTSAGPWDDWSDGSDLVFATYVQVGPSPFVDTFGSTFFWDIEWLFESGITKGCTPIDFCPDDAVTRGQMAAFLDRALDLPATTVDHFSDDDDSTFEAHIDRLAAAGITKGCTPTTFCPDETVTRGQMAAFLDRALDLPATTIDHFSDDEDSTFEAHIDRLAAAGITKGCSPTTFCPTADVTRGQMAAFLRRALD